MRLRQCDLKDVRRYCMGGWIHSVCQIKLRLLRTIDEKKRVLRFFYFGHHVFTFLTFFLYFPNVFYFKKRLQSSERQAD